MADDGDFSHNVVLRNILANIQTGDSGGASDCVAQLLAAAVAQFGNNATAVSSTDLVQLNTEINSSCDEQKLDPEGVEAEVVVEPTSVEVPTIVKRKAICMKFPIELRKQIIAMRKEGKKCVEVAKELHVSVSGAQKVWERFLATGTVHDRKPSTYAGRPRKYSQHQVITINILNRCV